MTIGGKHKIVITMSSSDQYAQHMGVAIASIMKNKNADEYIKIYIVDGGISDDNKNKLLSLVTTDNGEINFIVPNTECINGYNTGIKYISNVTYYRLLVPMLFPGEDRILHIDSDTVIMSSLKEFFNKDFGNNLVLGVKDVDADLSAKRLGVKSYINAGIVLFNAKRIRDENIVDNFFEWAENNKNKIERCDQDILNGTLDGRIGYIENIYNTQVVRTNNSKFNEVKNPVILHYISAQKPWNYWKPLNSTPWAKEYFKVLKETPWRSFILEYNIKSTLILPFRLFYPVGIFKKILNNIFSIRNSDDKKHKVLILFGIKIKFKRKKK